MSAVSSSAIDLDVSALNDPFNHFDFDAAFEAAKREASSNLYPHSPTDQMDNDWLSLYMDCAALADLSTGPAIEDDKAVELLTAVNDVTPVSKIDGCQEDLRVNSADRVTISDENNTVAIKLRDQDLRFDDEPGSPLLSDSDFSDYSSMTDLPSECYTLNCRPPSQALTSSPSVTLFKGHTRDSDSLPMHDPEVGLSSIVGLANSPAPSPQKSSIPDETLTKIECEPIKIPLPPFQELSLSASSVCTPSSKGYRKRRWDTPNSDEGDGDYDEMPKGNPKPKLKRRRKSGASTTKKKERVSCNKCHTTFTRQADVDRHIKSVHVPKDNKKALGEADPMKRLWCVGCGHVLARVDARKRHEGTCTYYSRQLAEIRGLL